MPGQAVGPDAAEEDEQHGTAPGAPSRTMPELRGRPVQRVEHGERERDRRHRAAHHRDRAPGEEQAELPLAERAEPAQLRSRLPVAASDPATTARTARRGRRPPRPRRHPPARRRRTPAGSMPSRTRAAQRSSSARAGRGATTTSSWTPKWISARRSGARARGSRRPSRATPRRRCPAAARPAARSANRASGHRLRRPRAACRRGSS